MEYEEQCVIMDLLRSDGWRVLSFHDDELIVKKGNTVVWIDFQWEAVHINGKFRKAKRWGVIPLLDAILD